jgi:hypothetical protein
MYDMTVSLVNSQLCKENGHRKDLERIGERDNSIFSVCVLEIMAVMSQLRSQEHLLGACNASSSSQINRTGTVVAPRGRTVSRAAVSRANRNRRPKQAHDIQTDARKHAKRDSELGTSSQTDSGSCEPEEISSAAWGHSGLPFAH